MGWRGGAGSGCCVDRSSGNDVLLMAMVGWSAAAVARCGSGGFASWGGVEHSLPGAGRQPAGVMGVSGGSSGDDRSAGNGVVQAAGVGWLAAGATGCGGGEVDSDRGGEALAA